MNVAELTGCKVLLLSIKVPYAEATKEDGASLGAGCILRGP